MTLPRFELHRPSTLTEAAALRSEEHVALGGGTELLLAMRMGMLEPEALVDLKQVPDLRQITRADDEIVIGAASTHDDIATNELVLETLPMLAHVAAHVGNPRVRMQGTIGGNIVFAEPKSDVIAALIALDGVADIASPDGTRTVTLAEFVMGPYWTDINEDEILVRVRVPLVAGRRAVYEKFQTMERPTIGVALRADREGPTRLVIAAVCSTPVILDFPTVDDIDPHAVAQDIEVVPDLTGKEPYKRHLTTVVVQRTIDALAQIGA